MLNVKPPFFLACLLVNGGGKVNTKKKNKS
jgi:hypothetical protein